MYAIGRGYETREAYKTCPTCDGTGTTYKDTPCTHKQYQGHYYCTHTGEVANELHDD